MHPGTGVMIQRLGDRIWACACVLMQRGLRPFLLFTSKIYVCVMKLKIMCVCVGRTEDREETL